MKLYKKYPTVTVNVLSTIEMLTANNTLTVNNKSEWITLIYGVIAIDERYNSSVAMWQEQHNIYTNELLTLRYSNVNGELTAHYMINTLLMNITEQIVKIINNGIISMVTTS